MSADKPSFRVAIAQASPVLFDRDASTQKACELIGKAAADGACMVAFGETWLPGYPIHMATQVAGLQRPGLNARYLDNSVEIPSPTTDLLADAAKDAEIDVVIGVVERDRHTQGTVYASLLFIGSDGRLLGRHRKLKPTSYERMAWGDGDGRGLTVHERPYARISGMNCWEHNMMLPGYALAAQGTQLHVAAWPGMEPDAGRSATRQTLLSRAFASQAACYVLLAAGTYDPADVPEDLRDVALPLNGRSAVIDPFGEVVAEAGDGESMLTWEVRLDVVRRAKAAFDVAGHYSRPDVLRLQVDRGDGWRDARGLEVAPGPGEPPSG